ncbi:MAG: hypothetical protein J6125_00500, partial [Clostridia bacterium]|nr:hypothetical protein [Clostridia bacterium]
RRLPRPLLSPQLRLSRRADGPVPVPLTEKGPKEKADGKRPDGRRPTAARTGGERKKPQKSRNPRAIYAKTRARKGERGFLFFVSIRPTAARLFPACFLF